MSQQSCVSMADSDISCNIEPEDNHTEYSMDAPPIEAHLDKDKARHLMVLGAKECAYCDGHTHHDGPPCFEGPNCGNIAGKKAARVLTHGGVYRPRSSCVNCGLFSLIEYRLLKFDLMIALSEASSTALSLHYLNQFQVSVDQSAEERMMYKATWYANYVNEKKDNRRSKQRAKKGGQKAAKRNKNRRDNTKRQSQSDNSSNDGEMDNEVPLASHEGQALSLAMNGKDAAVGGRTDDLVQMPFSCIFILSTFLSAFLPYVPPPLSSFLFVYLKCSIP
jgi:hypothetical protein